MIRVATTTVTDTHAYIDQGQHLRLRLPQTSQEGLPAEVLRPRPSRATTSLFRSDIWNQPYKPGADIVNGPSHEDSTPR